MAPLRSTVSFDELFTSLRACPRLLTHSAKECFSSLDCQDCLKNLRHLCNTLCSNASVKPPVVPPEYKEQWTAFINGRRKDIDLRAVRYLCWEPDIAATPQFLDYCARQPLESSRRAVQGLVRALHKRWTRLLDGNPTVSSKLIDIVRVIVKKYSGPNKVIQKWQEDTNKVLSLEATKLLAMEMVNTRSEVDALFDSWALDKDSDFALHTLSAAANSCRDQIGRNSQLCDYSLKTLLPWPRWDVTILKKHVGELILSEVMQRDSESRQKLLHYVCSDRRIGDPRLRANDRSWAAVRNDARERVIQWLSQLDIVFFFHHVLPNSRDPHGRKDFWLKYVRSLKASRPMLSHEDNQRLQVVLRREEGLVAHFGHMLGSNSVFLLDFGHIIAVEFSREGACYVYDSSVFNRIFPEFWSPRGYHEGKFRDQQRCFSRVCHYKGWQSELSKALSQKGIRPS